MGKPDAPTPPNPYTTAAAATGTNVSTAVANAFLNNTNQVTPTGNLTYDQTGTYNWTDPTTGSSYTIPRFTATQQLTDQGRAIQNQNLAAQYNLAGLANSESGNLAQYFQQGFDPLANAPAGGNASAISGLPSALTSFNAGGPLQTSIGGYGRAMTDVGPQDFSADRQQVQDALMARLNPQLDIQQSRLQQQLADQGIRYGSDAYNNAYTPFNQQANDARFAAIAQAGQEQQRMQQQLLAQGQFYNAGQQQNYDQALGAGSFANQAQGQLFQQNAAQATFANAGLAQQVAQQQAAFNAAQAARGAYMGEQYAARNQPLNEITALLGGSQVQMPNLTQTNQSQIPTTDIAGLINTNFNQQMQNYQQASTNYNTLTGGALGALGGYLRSDRRVKDVDHKIATVFAADDDGTSHELPIYKYSYKDDPTARKFAGPMAQDVEKINPQHVAEIGGRKFIRPQQVMGSILRAR